MSPRPQAGDEPLAAMRADATLRALAELDSLEPSRALDRAVLGRARDAASARTCRAGGDAQRRRVGPALRWGFPAAVAAAAVCAVVAHRTASRPGAPRVADQRFVVARMQTPQSTALEMVQVSAHYRGTGPQLGAPAVSAYLAPSGLEESHRALIPSLILTSVPLLTIRTAPLRKHGSEEQTPRAATRPSERAFRRDREWTARRRMRPPGLIDSVDLLESRPPPPPPALERVVGSSGRSARVGDAPGPGARAEALSTAAHSNPR